MFKHLVALLLAPLLRPAVNAVLILLLVAVAITIPARLWVMYVDPRPSGQRIAALNVATFVLLLCAAIMWRLRRHRRSAGRGYSAR